jgi:hypothetical protein
VQLSRQLQGLEQERDNLLLIKESLTLKVYEMEICYNNAELARIEVPWYYLLRFDMTTIL